ncbi:MAG: helix-turn-helix transcriptional regulator [Oscillibacter sp.]|nr:helix-turn-helix transcriptional regulator [Oscillibacter sp.]
MNISENIADLRRKRGWSQEHLAEQLGVTRQSVSKWESGTATPELEKLVALADLFGVSLDALAREDWTPSPSTEPTHLERQVEELSRYVRGYAYDSPIRLWGLPLVSIRLSRNGLGRDSVARGIIAIGNIALGVVAVGCLSVGIVSVGAFALGVLSIAALALGAVSLGALSVGFLAFGSCAVGVYSCGVAAVASDIAVGVAATASQTAIGEQAAGEHVLLWGSGLTQAQVEAFLLTHHPNLWRPLLRLLSFAGSVIQ